MKARHSSLGEAVSTSTQIGRRPLPELTDSNQMRRYACGGSVTRNHQTDSQDSATATVYRHDRVTVEAMVSLSDGVVANAPLSLDQRWHHVRFQPLGLPRRGTTAIPISDAPHTWPRFVLGSGAHLQLHKFGTGGAALGEFGEGPEIGVTLAW